MNTEQSDVRICLIFKEDKHNEFLEKQSKESAGVGTDQHSQALSIWAGDSSNNQMFSVHYGQRSRPLANPGF
jgi:hypothetical protein